DPPVAAEAGPHAGRLAHPVRPGPRRAAPRGRGDPAMEPGPRDVEPQAGVARARGPPAARSRAARRPGGRRMTVLVVLVPALVAAVALTSAVRSRDARSGITGSNQDPLAFFEQRVRDHPNDVAARLDLASRYLDAGNVPGAVEQDLEALRLDPTNAEAHADL